MNLKSIGIGERAVWNDFPEVIRNGNPGTLKNEPEYEAAKSGDISAAIDLVDKLLTDDTVEKIRIQIKDNKPRILPVLAMEATGNNKIPLAMAEVIADRLSLDVELGIIQSDKVSRTNTGADYRLAFNPRFEGDVRQGQKYLIIDDTLTMGGTIASLRGYVENRGGKIVAACVMTAHEKALNLPVKSSMLAAIENKHGPSVNQFWQETFGYGTEKLTQGEAGHLKSAKTVDTIRERITAARYAGIERLDTNRVETPLHSKGTKRSSLTGENLFLSAKGVEVKQQAIIEGVSVKQNYQETLAIYVQAKHNQAESIKDRLENLINQQQAQLQQTQSNRPSVLSMPGTRKAWQASQVKQQSRLQTLHIRLEKIQEIKESMGLHSTRIEEMATRKMRAENPKLATDWDLMKQAKRQHQALMKKQEQEKRQTQEKSRSLSLGLNRPRQ